MSARGTSCTRPRGCDSGIETRSELRISFRSNGSGGAARARKNRCRVALTSARLVTKSEREKRGFFLCGPQRSFVIFFLGGEYSLLATRPLALFHYLRLCITSKH